MTKRREIYTEHIHVNTAEPRQYHMHSHCHRHNDIREASVSLSIYPSIYLPTHPSSLNSSKAMRNFLIASSFNQFICNCITLWSVRSGSI